MNTPIGGFEGPLSVEMIFYCLNLQIMKKFYEIARGLHPTCHRVVFHTEYNNQSLSTNLVL